MREETPVARSPDGRLLLIKRESEDGFELILKPWPALDRVAERVELRHSPMGLQWSPDGRAICFLARHYGPFFQPWLWIIGEEPRVLAEAPRTTLAVTAPAWHPNSQHFLYWAEGNLYSAGLVSIARNFRGAVGQAGFAWSPAGDRIAAVGALRPGHLQIVSPEGKRESLIQVCPSGAIRDVSWTRLGLFVTARAAAAEWYQVAKVESSGACAWLTSDPGDKRRPTKLSDGGIAWEMHRSGARSLSQHAGAGLPYTGYQARNWSLHFTSPSGVVAAEEQAGREPLTYPGQAQLEEKRPRLITFPSPDGVAVPGWLWEPEEIKGTAIEVHGAPRLAASPYHAPGIRYLLEQGIAVLALNFRGSSGAGRAWEELPGDPADDLRAARHWLAQRHPQIPMVLHGHSFGALLALRSTLGFPSAELAGLVLVSLRLPKERPPLQGWPGLSIQAFHGTWDLVAPAREAQSYLGQIPGGAEVRFTEFPEEGHAFHRRANLLQSYQAAAAMLLAR